MVTGTVCPHLKIGDCLLFDTRVLHFGLGNLKHNPASGVKQENTAEEVGPDRVRAMLYINYWQRWWNKNTDKNWGQVSLFPEKQTMTTE